MNLQIPHDEGWEHPSKSSKISKTLDFYGTKTVLMSDLILQIQEFGRQVKELENLQNNNLSRKKSEKQTELLLKEKNEEISKIHNGLKYFFKREKDVEESKRRIIRNDVSTQKQFQLAYKEYEEIVSNLITIKKEYRKKLQDMKSFQTWQNYIIEEEEEGLEEHVEYGNSVSSIRKKEEKVGLTTFQEATFETYKLEAIEQRDVIYKLEEDLNELKTMFEDFNVLVDKQQMGLNKIEHNVDDSIICVETGVEEIKLANKHYARGRWSMYSTLIILVVFLLIMAILVFFGLLQRLL